MLKPAAPAARPHLPRMLPVAGGFVPAAPADLRDTGLDRGLLLDLALKAAALAPQFTTESLARQLCLPQAVAAELLEQLRSDQMLDVLGQAGPLGFRYSVSGKGRERAARLFEVSGYVGPAPVSLPAYTALLDWQLEHAPPVTPAMVGEALAPLVLADEAVLLAGLAASSGRSLFVYGPPGNGKTHLSRLLHQALDGGFWVPHCLAVENSIIRVHDPQLHEPIGLKLEQPWTADARWVLVHRPLIVGGGELTLESFELSYSPSLRYYEAPLHVKSNGGCFLIDDFGRQRVDPHEMLNRWIIPLENQIDFLTLHTGQKIQVPFHTQLIFATNLSPDDVTDPAFLRRIGYRLRLDPPTPEQYADIFRRYAGRLGVEADAGVLGRLLERYRKEGRDYRACEPRDLVERVRDICTFRGRSLELNDELLAQAWMGYFGN